MTGSFETDRRRSVRKMPVISGPATGQFDTILYLVRQTTGAEVAQIHIDGMPPEPVPAGLQCLQVPLVHQGERFGVLRAYASQFASGAAHLLAGFAVLVAEHHALWSVAQLDMLTGAMTRRAFQVDLGNAVASWSRSGTACSLITFDLDHFKSINDTYGHAAGDIVLRTVANMVRSELRPADRLGRLGGEEFGVLVLADAATAMDIAERLRAVIETTVLREHPQIDFTSSFGVASCGEAGETREALLATADARLYAAKSQGRNCVVGPPGVHAAAAFS